MKHLDAGVDGIKVHLQPPAPPNVPIPVSALEAAVAAAHRAGKPVFVHPNAAADVTTAARAGVDVIAHTTPTSGPWDESIVSVMKGKRVALIPTLMGWKTLLRHERVSVQESSVANTVAQLRAWNSFGGITLFGTDLGAVDYDPTDEYTLMAQAGMTFSQILASLTTAPSERFGASDRLGRIAPGLDADVTIIRGDVASNVSTLADVRYTLRRRSRRRCSSTRVPAPPSSSSVKRLLTLAVVGVALFASLATAQIVVTDPAVTIKNAIVATLRQQVLDTATQQAQRLYRMARRLSAFSDLRKYAISDDDTPKWRIHVWLGDQFLYAKPARTFAANRSSPASV